jgi:hypothetical protein
VAKRKRNHNPWPLERRLGLLESKPLTGTIEKIAAAHAQRRCEIVAYILCHVHLMRVYGRLGANATTATRGAGVQFFQGEKKKSTEGAHCVPRELIADGKPLYEHLPRLCVQRSLLQGLFSEVDIIPAAVNSVDSDCERKGVEQAFLEAVRIAGSSPEYSTDVVTTAYNLFAKKSRVICDSVCAESHSKAVRANDEITLHYQTKTGSTQAVKRERDDLKQDRTLSLDKRDAARACAQVFEHYAPVSLTPGVMAALHQRYEDHQPAGRDGCSFRECLPGAAAAHS